MKKVIYIAGPMSGLPDHNYAAFVMVARFLRSEGWEVRSPVEIASAIATPEQIDADRHVCRKVLDAERAVIRDECDAIYLLPNWETSSGARMELAEAICDKLEIILHYDYVANGFKYSPEKPELKGVVK